MNHETAKAAALTEHERRLVSAVLYERLFEYLDSLGDKKGKFVIGRHNELIFVEEKHGCDKS